MSVAADNRNLKRAAEAGRDYGEEQLLSTHFADWVFEQLSEATHIEVARGLELPNLVKSKKARLDSARLLLQQLKWDTERALDDRDVANLLRKTKCEANSETGRAFWRGFVTYLADSSTRDWVADELVLTAAESLMKNK